MFRNWCLGILVVFDTCYVFINPVSEWSSCFPNILFPTFCALNEVNNITDFACNQGFGREVYAFVLFSCVVAGEHTDLGQSRIVCAFT